MITGLVYAVLLTGDNVDVTAAWIDVIVHRIMPIVMVVDWLVDPPPSRLSYRRCLLWLAFPLVYFCYSLVRGSVTDWYPYYFIDPDEGGYAQVFTYVAVLTPLMALTALAVAWLGNLASGWGHPQRRGPPSRAG